MLLAQIQNVDPGFLHQFTLLGMGMIGGAAGLAAIMGFFRKKQVEVAMGDSFVTKEHCSTLHASASAKGSAMEAMINEMRAERRGDINDLHGKVNSIAREVSELKATTSLELAQLARIDQKLADLQSR